MTDGNVNPSSENGILAAICHSVCRRDGSSRQSRRKEIGHGCERHQGSGIRREREVRQGDCRLLGDVVRSVQDAGRAHRPEDRPEHPEITVLKVNVDEEPALAARFGVMSIPTLILYKDGQMLEQIVGLTKPDEILSKLA